MDDEIRERNRRLRAQGDANEHGIVTHNQYPIRSPMSSSPQGETSGGAAATVDSRPWLYRSKLVNDFVSRHEPEAVQAREAVAVGKRFVDAGRGGVDYVAGKAAKYRVAKHAAVAGRQLSDVRYVQPPRPGIVGNPAVRHGAGPAMRSSNDYYSSVRKVRSPVPVARRAAATPDDHVKNTNTWMDSVLGVGAPYRPVSTSKKPFKPKADRFDMDAEIDRMTGASMGRSKTSSLLDAKGMPDIRMPGSKAKKKGGF